MALSVASYAGRLVAVVLYLVFVSAFGWGVRRLLAPHLAGSIARLAEAAVAIAWTVLLTELLGTLGILDELSLLLVSGIGAAAAAGSGSRTIGRFRPVGGSGRRSLTHFRWDVAAIVPAVAGAFGQWSAWTAKGLQEGPAGVDTLRYHLPLVTRFIQGQSPFKVQFLDQDLLASYDPLNAEMLHVDAGVLFGSDLLSVVLNLFWFALAVLAAVCLARRIPRSGPAVILATLLAMCVRDIGPMDAGGALNDIAVLALLLMSTAFVAEAVDAEDGQPGRRTLVMVSLAGLCAGLAIGTKFYAIAPAVAMLAVLIFSVRRARLTVAGTWIAPAVAAGGYWYGRNWAATGNPSPETAVTIGPLHLAAVNDPVRQLTGYSVSHYLGDRHFVAHTAPSGLHYALGPGWWAILAAAFAGILMGAAKGPFLARVFSILAVASLVAYLVTPYGAGGLNGDPWLFPLDVRFAVPGILFGLLSLVITLESHPRAPAIVTGLLGILLLVTWLGDGAWPITDQVYGVTAAVVAAVLILIGIHPRPIRQARTPRVLAILTAAVAVAAGGYVVSRNYDFRRYSSNPLARWADSVPGARIGTMGFPELYPLFGNNFANEVVYLARPDGHGSLIPNLTCQEWAHTLRWAHVQYVVVGNGTLDPPGTPQIEWTQRVAGGHIVAVADGAEVLKLTAPPEAGLCASR